MTSEHLARIKSMARRLHPRMRPDIEVEDLVSVGVVAYLEAEARWDPSAGVNLWRYVSARVSGAMTDEIRRRRSGVGTYRAGLTAQSVARLRWGEYRLAGGPQPAAGWDVGRKADMVHIDDPDTTVAARQVAEAIATLPPRTQEIMRMYYVDDMPQTDIGEVIGLTESRVCQIRCAAEAKIRRRYV